MTLVPAEQRPDWINIMAPAVELAERIYRTEFVSAALRGRPEAVVACILAGHEVGIGPLQSLSKIYVVDGRPTMASELMRALILRAGHDIWTEENTTTRVTVCGRRSGREFVSKVTWTLDDAKRAGLSNKQNWQKYPRAMLLARATSELARLMFADVLGGISYSQEELEDGDNGASAPTAPPAKTVTRQARRAPALQAAPEAPEGPQETPPDNQPPLPGETGYDTPEALVQRAQVVATKARRAGVPRKAAAKAASHGRTESTKELSAEEAADALAFVDQNAGSGNTTDAGEVQRPLPDPAEPTRDQLVTTLKARVAKLRNPQIAELHAYMDQVGIGAERKAHELELDELLVVEAFLDRQELET